MLYNGNNFDFKYASFPLSLDTLEDYARRAIFNKKFVKDSADSYSHSGGVVDCIISSIASNDFSFDKHNKRVFVVLYKMLRDYAHDNGVYSDKARTAMRVLCEYCGFAPDAIILIDRKPLSRMERLKNRFGKWFGFHNEHNEHDEQENKIDQMFAETEHQTRKHDALMTETEKHRAELQREGEEKEQESSAKAQHLKEETRQAEKNHKETKTSRIVEIEQKKNENRKFGRFAAISATVTGFVALGATMLFGSHNSANIAASTVDNNKEPTFKNIYVEQSSHYNNVSTYNMIDSLKKQKTNLDSLMQYNIHSIVKSQQQTEEKQIVQTAENKELADVLTKASRTALDILIGSKRAQKLCNKVEAQVKAGIFKLPDGMSVEHVAHAMEMSRIYEGHSVILDALKSNVKLTAEQQHAFNNHIIGIGDLGVKIQQRMMSKQKLNNHSRYDKAKKSLRMAHAKNLKQLRQLKKRMR